MQKMMSCQKWIRTQRSHCDLELLLQSQNEMHVSHVEDKTEINKQMSDKHHHHHFCVCSAEHLSLFLLSVTFCYVGVMYRKYSILPLSPCFWVIQSLLYFCFSRIICMYLCHLPAFQSECVSLNWNTLLHSPLSVDPYISSKL